MITQSKLIIIIIMQAIKKERELVLFYYFPLIIFTKYIQRALLFLSGNLHGEFFSFFKKKMTTFHVSILNWRKKEIHKRGTQYTLHKTTSCIGRCMAISIDMLWFFECMRIVERCMSLLSMDLMYNLFGFQECRGAFA